MNVMGYGECGENFGGNLGECGRNVAVSIAKGVCTVSVIRTAAE